MASKQLHIAALDAALQQQGLNDKQLAETLGVSRQAVSKWRSGLAFPRPAVLLRLAKLLKLSFGDLVKADAPTPVVAFRKKAGAKTTEAHLQKGQRLGGLLRPLIPYLQLPSLDVTRIAPARLDPESIQAAAERRRRAMGLADDAVVENADLVRALANNGALLVPVHWGEHGRHENAMHIELPECAVTFIYLNLDCRLYDIKFWIAHELAHTLTPDLSGTNEGEDFADQFAAAFLVPAASAVRILTETQGRSGAQQLESVCNIAHHLGVNPLTVFYRANDCAARCGLSPLSIEEKFIHQINAKNNAQTLAAHLWPEGAPSAQVYVRDVSDRFQTDMFAALRRMLRDGKGDAGYVQQVLDVPRADAEALAAALIH